MLRYFILSIAVLLVAACGETKPVTAEVQKTPPVLPLEKRVLIAVGDFQNKSGEPAYNNLMEPLTGSLIFDLQNTYCFRLVERERLKSLLEETKLGLSGLTDPSKTKEVGKLLGVDAILFVNLASVQYHADRKEVGSILEVKEYVDTMVDGRLVAVETGEILAASRVNQSQTNIYKVVGSIKEGSPADQTQLVQKALENSTRELAIELAFQSAAR